MSEKLRLAMAAGVVKAQAGGHWCEACNRDVVEIMPHMESTGHSNNMIWEALKNSSLRHLTSGIPPVVLEAMERNEVELVDKTLFSLKCLVCDKPCSGITSLESHLKGRDHKRTKERKALSAISPPVHTMAAGPMHQFPPSTQPSNTQTQYAQQFPASTQPSNTQTQYAQQFPASTQPSNTQTQYAQQFPAFIQPSNTQTQYAPQFPPSVQPSNIVPHYVPQPQQQQPQPQTQFQTHYPPLPLATEAPSPGVPAGAEGFDPEVRRALSQGVVTRPDSQSFLCNVCNKSVNGTAPCLQHLKSDKHKKKELLWTQQQQQQLPDIGQLSLDGVFDSLPIFSRGRGRDRQADFPLGLPWEIKYPSRPVQPSDTVYRNLSEPRGLVLIFNYYFRGTSRMRHGAERDSINIKTLFERMGYVVYLYEEYTKTKTLEAIAKTKENPLLNRIDSFIVFIMSHGLKDQTFEAVPDGNNGDNTLTVDDVRYRFIDTDCPALNAKPKLFFVNICRGVNVEPHITFDGSVPQRSSPKDMVTLYSCINSFRTPRDEERGTIFVQAWCEVLAAHAHNKDLQDLCTHADRVAEAKKGSTIEFQAYRFKRFFFNPMRY